MSQFNPSNPVQPFSPPQPGGQPPGPKVSSRPPGEPAAQAQQLFREKQLGAPPVGPWASGAKAAWGANRPFLVRHLNAAGQLETSLDRGTQAAKAQFGKLVQSGANPFTARAAVTHNLNQLPHLGPEPADLPGKIRQVGQFHQLLAAGNPLKQSGQLGAPKPPGGPSIPRPGFPPV